MHKTGGALLTTLLLLSMAVAVSALPPSPQKLCYFDFGTPENLGWTFSFNNGRFKTNTALQSMFPTLNVQSIGVTNIFTTLLNGADPVAFAESYIQQGCTMIITNDASLLGSDAQADYLVNTYTNISFITLVNNAYDYNNTQTNRFPVLFSFESGFYLAGVAMATQGVSTCVGFLSAWENQRNPVEAFNGFMLGLRSVNPNIPVQVVTMNSWSVPTEEVIAAQLLVDGLGCDQIAHYSDSRSVDVWVNSVSNGSLFSVPPNANLLEYVGDSVLVSVYTSWSEFLVPIISTLWTTGAFNYSFPRVQTITTGGEIISQVSPIALSGVQAAVNAATGRFADSPLVVCGPNTYTFTNGTSVTLAAGSCIGPYDPPIPYIQFPNAVYQGAWQYSTNCPAGTMATYATQPMIALQCLPCAANTYSTAPGSTSCTPCPPGLVSSPNATACGVPARTAMSQATVGGLVGGLTALLVVLLAALLVIRARNARKHKNAPREPPFALLFTDVEGSTGLWQAHPKAMSAAMLVHHNVIRDTIEECGAYEVKTVGDSFMIAAQTAYDGVELAIAIQRKLQSATWPSEFRYGGEWNGLKVRIGVHYCRDVEVRFESLRNYYDYYGNDVNAAARVEAAARGGQILLTKETLEQLRQDDDYAVLLAEVQIKLFARNVTLKGLEEDFTLYSIVPSELSGRQFEPLENHEHDLEVDIELEDMTGVKRSASGSSASSMHSDGGGTKSMAGQATRILLDSLDAPTLRTVFRVVTGVDAGTRQASRMISILAHGVAAKLAATKDKPMVSPKSSRHVTPRTPTVVRENSEE